MVTKNDIPEFGPLAGVKVINAATSIAGPIAAQMMAEWGADVIWIESPRGLDVARTSMSGDQDRRNQRALCLNIPTPEGREVFLELIRDTDILIEASKGGQYDKWGLSDEVLWECNPALVIVHLSGFGQYGDPEYVQRPSFDAIAQAFSCFMNFNGFPDRPPVPAAPYIGDYLPGYLAVGSALAAMHKAKQTGKGDSIDLAQFEVLIRSQMRYPMEFLNKGQLVTDKTRPGDRSDKFAAFGNYQCKDGNRVYISILGDKPFKAALKFFGLEYGSEEYPAGTIFSPVGTSAGNKLEARLMEYLASKTADEADKELTAAGVPVSVIMNYQMAVNHPHYQARNVFCEWENIQGKTVKGVKIVPDFKNNPGKVWRGLPSIGMDNDDILSEHGFSKKKIQDLYDKKIIVKK